MAAAEGPLLRPAPAGAVAAGAAAAGAAAAAAAAAGDIEVGGTAAHALAGDLVRATSTKRDLRSSGVIASNVLRHCGGEAYQALLQEDAQQHSAAPAEGMEYRALTVQIKSFACYGK